MIQLIVEIPESIAQGFENRLMQLEIPSWTIREDKIGNITHLIGYFDSEKEGLESYTRIKAGVPELGPLKPICAPVIDRDWKESYKEHFNPWRHGTLHWVPLWLKERYPLPAGQQAVYLDPGMAFGTGNHETTKLCAIRIVEAAKDWGTDVFSRSVADVGCGSGILAISAAKLGFCDVFAFDLDQEAVIIAKENSRENDTAKQVRFASGDIAENLANKKFDLVLANILANVLIQNAQSLLNAVRPGGRLILSGILATELVDVKSIFESRARALWEACDIRSRLDGEWADIMLVKPGMR